MTPYEKAETSATSDGGAQQWGGAEEVDVSTEYRLFTAVPPGPHIRTPHQSRRRPRALGSHAARHAFRQNIAWATDYTAPFFHSPSLLIRQHILPTIMEGFNCPIFAESRRAHVSHVATPDRMAPSVTAFAARPPNQFVDAAFIILRRHARYHAVAAIATFRHTNDETAYRLIILLFAGAPTCRPIRHAYSVLLLSSRYFHAAAVAPLIGERLRRPYDIFCSATTSASFKHTVTPHHTPTRRRLR